MISQDVLGFRGLGLWGPASTPVEMVLQRPVAGRPGQELLRHPHRHGPQPVPHSAPPYSALRKLSASIPECRDYSRAPPLLVAATSDPGSSRTQQRAGVG